MFHLFWSFNAAFLEIHKRRSQQRSIRSITFLPAHLRAGRECEVRSLIEYAWGLVRRREGGSVRRKKGNLPPRDCGCN